MAFTTVWVRRCARCRTVDLRLAWDDPAQAPPPLDRGQEGCQAVLSHRACGLLVKRYGENIVVGTMADGEGARGSRIAPRSSGDCKDIWAAEWW